MSPNLGGWIHNFTVTDTQTHKGGYTIYKITSIVFPRSVPQALTCLVVWKRFHEIKRLHRELNRRHKALNLPGKLPEPTDASFFKRFEPDVIARRKDYILELLDFAAQHPALYKCHPFTQFFSDDNSKNESPLHRLHLEHSGNNDIQCENKISYSRKSSAINEICDQIDMCYDPQQTALPLIDPECDKLNDDSVETKDNALSDNEDVAAVEETETVKSVYKDYSRLLTPMASVESDDGDYIYEAALEFSHAVQAEVNLEYREAHMRYKRGVDVLLNGSRDDCNEERTYIAKAKIAKYLARVNEIYERFLRYDGVDGGSPNKSNFQLSIDVADPNNTRALFLERPWNQLAKYKVLQILGDRVIQVQCITEPQHPIYVMKGIEKPSSNSPTQSIFLPQQVPYMVDLLGFFQSEQKIFLLLKHAKGGRLYDYIQSYSPGIVGKHEDVAELFPEITPSPEESSYEISSTASIQDSGYADTGSTVSTLEEATEFSAIVRSSQQLLRSVSKTLKEVKVVGKTANSYNKTNANLPEASLKQWARELAVAINTLHGKGIILRDLHMDNLLLGCKGQLLLTYFYQNEGLSFEDNHVHKALSMQALHEHFVAPERPLTIKSDWWSYGIILYQMVVGLPFKVLHPGNIDLYSCVQYPEHSEISECAQDLLENLIQHVPEERFGFEQVQAHEFFAGTNWQEVIANGYNSTMPTVVQIPNDN